MSRLVLASASPQRKAILEQLGLEFDVRPPEVNELADGDPRHVAAENARRKAHAIALEHRAATVIGCDTVVALDERIYDKPRDEAEARATLLALSGRDHLVLSGLCVKRDGGERAGVATTWVRFRALSEPLVDWYLASEEWRDRAGGYAIQGRGAALVAAIEGDYQNVVGLPVVLLLDLVPELLTSGSASVR
jgi:septum formation protein